MASGHLEHGERDKYQEAGEFLVNCIEKEAEKVGMSILPTIYMVPGVIRDLSASSFSPRVVSIGPLHREDKNVKAFEKQKVSFVRNLMNRIDLKTEEIFQSCMEKAGKSMERIKACYVWTETKETYDDVEIAKMMVMDACFILEFINWDKDSGQRYPGINLRPLDILSDLVLLENQIPFFFLDQIYRCTILKMHPSNTTTLIEFMQPLLNRLSIFTEEIETPNISIDHINHILSLLHECYKPDQQAIKRAPSTFKTIPSATDLDMAGVSFDEHRKDRSWVMEMEVTPYKFPYLFGWCWGKTTLRMSKLSINDSTELVLRNLIAYEQSCQDCDHITSYVWAIDMLVNTKEDVAKLVDSGVLANEMGSNEEAANIINSLGKELPCGEFFYHEQRNALDENINSYWPKRIAWLRRTYFHSPWNIFSLSGAIILFVLTVVQTYFTIMSN